MCVDYYFAVLSGFVRNVDARVTRPAQLQSHPVSVRACSGDIMTNE